VKLKAVFLDLDGTVYRGAAEVPGAADFVRYCHQRGLRCLFITNRANRTPLVVRDQLRGYGIPCETEDVLTSAQATARYLGGGTAWMIGEAGMEEALAEVGVRLTDQNPDAVVVSFDRQFSYDKMVTACKLIGKGARFVATNPDHRLTFDGEIFPGTGSIVAAVATGSGVAPEVVGKPERRIFDMALDMIGCRPEEVLSIGDNIDTDIGASVASGIKSVLLLTGISSRADVTADKPQPDYILEDFAAVTALVETL